MSKPEPKRCPTCNQIIEEGPPLPVAHRVSLHYCGRQLFYIEGESGLWCKKPGYGENDGRRVVCRGEPDGRCRGKQVAFALHLLVDVTDQARTALLPLTEATARTEEHRR